MAFKRINNEANFIGRIFEMYQTDTVTILTVDTGSEEGTAFHNHPHIYCFGKTKQIIDNNYQKGDVARFNCSIQENLKIKGKQVPDHSAILFNVTRINSEDVEFQNSFRLFGRLVSVRKITPYTAVGTVCIRTQKNNFFTVRFSSEDVAKVDKFCAILPNQMVIFDGHVKTGRTKKNEEVRYYETCSIDSFEIVQSKK